MGLGGCGDMGVGGSRGVQFNSSTSILSVIPLGTRVGLNGLITDGEGGGLSFRRSSFFPTMKPVITATPIKL